MTWFVFRLTCRQLILRRSTLLLAGLAFLPVLLAGIFQLSDPDQDPERWTARTLYLGLVITGVLPLTTLLLGTSVLGDELEDGTAIYLLTKPIPRWQILLPKLAAAWLVSVGIVVPAAVLAGEIALDWPGGSSIIIGFAVAMVVGALAYTTVFVLLSLTTSRALISGLVYVFLWEGAITAIFEGARYLSIRHYTLGIAGWIADTRPVVFDPYIGGVTALVLISITTVVALVLASRQLQEIEVREPS